MMIKKPGLSAIDNNEIKQTNEKKVYDENVLDRTSAITNTRITDEKLINQLEKTDTLKNIADKEQAQATMTDGIDRTTSKGSVATTKIPGCISKDGSRSRGRRGLRTGSVTKEIYLFVREHYGMDTPFVTEGVYKEFIQRGYCSSDVSGHLYSLKQQGYLESDDWSDAELASYGFDGEENRLRKNLKKWVLIKENQLNKCNDEKTRDGGVSNDEH